MEHRNLNVSSTSTHRADLVWCLDSPGFGGAERDLLRVLDMLAPLDLRHHVAHGSPLDERFRSGLLRRGADLLPISGGSKARYLLRSWASARALTRRFRGAGWIVWCHHFDTCRWLQLHLAWSGESFALAERFRATGKGDFRRSHLTIPLKRWVLRPCVEAVVPARGQVEEYAELFAAPRGRVACIPNTRDVDALARRGAELGRRRAAVRASLGLPVETPLIVTVGRLCPQKAQAVVVGSTALLRARGRPVHLCLVGDGPDREELRRMCSAVIPDASTMAGEQADPVPYLAAADVFVLASQVEGLSGALVEAMAVGVPVVVSDIPANRELVQNARTGLLCSPGSPESLADALTAMLSDATLAATCSAAAHRLVKEQYDAALEATLWRDLAMRLTGAAARGSVRPTSGAFSQLG